MAKFAQLAFDTVEAPPLARDKSKSAAQARLMAAIAHGGKLSGLKKPPSENVAKEFNEADKGTSMLKRATKKN